MWSNCTTMFLQLWICSGFCDFLLGLQPVFQEKFNFQPLGAAISSHTGPLTAPINKTTHEKTDCCQVKLVWTGQVKKKERKKNIILKNKKSAHATKPGGRGRKCLHRWWHPEAKKTKKNQKEWRLTFLGTSHNVCSRFYIQMSSSRRPLRGLFTLSRKLISYSLAADRKLTLTCEWHKSSRLVGLLNFSSDQSFYTNTGQNLSPYSFFFFSLWCFFLPPLPFFFAHVSWRVN